MIYLIQLRAMYLHHSFIHLTLTVLRPNVFVVFSTSSTNRMTVLIYINFHRMKDQILFIYRYFTCRILYYLKIIRSINLGIKYWTISDVGCATKSDSFTTAVRVGTTSMSTIRGQIFVDELNKLGFCPFYSGVQKCSISSRH